MRLLTAAPPRNASTRSKRWSFLITSRPPTTTNAIIGRLPPIHQLADWFMAKAVMTTAIAAGLKICFLPMVKMYFDAIAKITATRGISRKKRRLVHPA